MEVRFDVMQTWEDVKRMGIDPIGKLFFRNFFTIAPDALELYSFKSVDKMYHSKELKVHYTKVLDMIDQIVRVLDDSDTTKIEQKIRRLGKKHVGYKVMLDHFPLFERALYMTFDAAIRDKFDEDVKLSW